MKNLFYKTILWITEYSPDVIAIPIGRWLENQINKKRKEIVLDKFAEFLLQWEKKAKRK